MSHDMTDASALLSKAFLGLLIKALYTFAPLPEPVQFILSELETKHNVENINDTRLYTTDIAQKDLTAASLHGLVNANQQQRTTQLNLSYFVASPRIVK